MKNADTLSRKGDNISQKSNLSMMSKPQSRRSKKDRSILWIRDDIDDGIQWSDDERYRPLSQHQSFFSNIRD